MENARRMKKKKGELKENERNMKRSERRMNGTCKENERGAKPYRIASCLDKF